jgi:hypothetical protein
MSYISQLASRVGRKKGSWEIAFHITTLPGSGRGAGRGVAFLPLDISGSRLFLNPDPDQDPGFYTTETKKIYRRKFCESFLWPP